MSDMADVEYREIEVEDRDGGRRTADLARCGHCGREEFRVFQLRNQGHFHLQCGGCGTSYCPFGNCEGDDD
jgi:hypothetical protein